MPIGFSGFLPHRLIVAGGGGGGAWGGAGGSGGGLQGASTSSSTKGGASGGMQSGPGYNYNYGSLVLPLSIRDASNGTFGAGGDSERCEGTTACCGSGGGGGGGLVTM